MTLTPDPNAVRIARDIAQVRRISNDQARASQAARRSVELDRWGGVNYYLNGKPVAHIGLTTEGDVVLNRPPEYAPIPPVPSRPTAEPQVGGVAIRWDGLFMNGVWNSGIRHIEIHMLSSPNQTPSDATQIGVFASSRGGDWFHSISHEEGEKHYALQAISVANLESELSASFPATAIPAVDPALWQEHEDALNNLNNVTLPALEGEIDDNSTNIYTLTTVTIPDLQEDLDTLNNTTIPGLDAQLDAANTAIIARARVLFQDAQPTGLTANDRVVWYDTNDGHAASYWNGTTWGPYSLGAGALAADSVIAGKIAAGAVTATAIATDAVIAGKIAAGAVVAGKIAADAVTATTIATNAVTADSIAASAVTATEIATDAVIAAKIAAGAVVAGKIAADAVTATTIAADAVTTNKIAAGAVTATELASDSVTAVKIVAGAVTVGKIAAGAVTATTIEANALTGKVIRTAPSGKRTEINSDPGDASRIRFYSAVAEENTPASISASSTRTDTNNVSSGVQIDGGTVDGSTGYATILVRSGKGMVGALPATIVRINAYNDSVNPAIVSIGAGPSGLEISDPAGTNNDSAKLTGSEVLLESVTKPVRITHGTTLTNPSPIMSTFKTNGDLEIPGNFVSKEDDVGWRYVGAAGQPAFTGGWQNFGGGHVPARFRKINGIVYLQGLIRLGGMGSGAFILPVGYRPAYTIMAVEIQGQNTAGRFDIYSNGNIVPTTGDPAFFSLTFVFPADQ